MGHETADSDWQYRLVEAGEAQIMEIIRRKTDYGIRALAHMALGDSERRVYGARDIAEARDVPEVYMQKVLHSLADAGIVQSHRGVFGGFSLVKEPSEITLFCLMEALQGPVAINRCVLGQDLCPREKKCMVRNRWEAIQEDLVKFLKGVTLEDLVADFAAEGAMRGAEAAVLPGIQDAQLGGASPIQ